MGDSVLVGIHKGNQKETTRQQYVNSFVSYYGPSSTEGWGTESPILSNTHDAPQRPSASLLGILGSAHLSRDYTRSNKYATQLQVGSQNPLTCGSTQMVITVHMDLTIYCLYESR